MQQQKDSFVNTDPSIAWMPLDGLIQLWAAFGNDACDSSQTAALQATSQAFAALAEERLAFRHYTTICARRQQQFAPPLNRGQVWTADDGKLAGPILTEQGSPVEALQQAAAHWLEAARLLEHCATHCCQEDEGLQHDLLVLMVDARSQRLRVWTIAHHLLWEELAGSRKQYGIITDLNDNENKDVAGTEGKKKP